METVKKWEVSKHGRVYLCGGLFTLQIYIILTIIGFNLLKTMIAYLVEWTFCKEYNKNAMQYH